MYHSDILSLSIWLDTLSFKVDILWCESLSLCGSSTFCIYQKRVFLQTWPCHASILEIMSSLFIQFISYFLKRINVSIFWTSGSSSEILSDYYRDWDQIWILTIQILGERLNCVRMKKIKCVWFFRYQINYWYMKKCEIENWWYPLYKICLRVFRWINSQVILISIHTKQKSIQRVLYLQSNSVRYKLHSDFHIIDIYILHDPCG